MDPRVREEPLKRVTDKKEGLAMLLKPMLAQSGYDPSGAHGS
jgi:hypothetical protein